MAALRVLHVDDESDIREIVRFSLSLDPEMETRSAASGRDALEMLRTWTPDVILLDVMMPTMDGPSTLGHLRENTDTAAIPVVFMTARVQTREVDRLLAMGAVDVIPKPFDPMVLAATMRGCVPKVDPLQAMRNAFLTRTGEDKAELSRLEAQLATEAPSGPALAEVRAIAHRLAGAGGIFGFDELSDAAAGLEETILADEAGARLVETGAAIGRLIAIIESKRR